MQDQAGNAGRQRQPVVEQQGRLRRLWTVASSVNASQSSGGKAPFLY